MIELTVVNSQNSDDSQDFTFRIDLGRRIPSVGTLRRGIKGNLWVLQRDSMLKSHYTEKDIQERARLYSTPPLRNGDVVVVEGQQFQIRVIGNYSDCAVLKPI